MQAPNRALTQMISLQGYEAEDLLLGVTNPQPPHHARVAMFSYTILAEQQNQPQIQQDLQMLEAEIETAVFSPELGVVPECPPIRK
jgi:hypothetical protein